MPPPRREFCTSDSQPPVRHDDLLARQLIQAHHSRCPASGWAAGNHDLQRIDRQLQGLHPLRRQRHQPHIGHSTAHPTPHIGIRAFQQHQLNPRMAVGKGSHQPRQQAGEHAGEAGQPHLAHLQPGQRRRLLPHLLQVPQHLPGVTQQSLACLGTASLLRAPAVVAAPPAPPNPSATVWLTLDWLIASARAAAVNAAPSTTRHEPL